MKLLLITALICGTTMQPTFANTKRPTVHNSHCTTPTCDEASVFIKHSLDEHVNPCTDFYKFACGGFIRKARAEGHKSWHSTNSLARKKVLAQVESLYNERALPNEPKPISEMKKYYRLCLDTLTVEKDGLQNAKGLLKKLGGWPTVDGKSWNEKGFDWKTFVAHSRKMGLMHYSLLAIFPWYNLYSTSQVVLWIKPPGFEMDSKSLSKGMRNPRVKAYYNVLVDTAVIFGAKKQDAQKDIKEMLKFEAGLAKLKHSKDNDTVLSNQIKSMTVDELQKKYPSINWVEFLEHIVDIPSFKVTKSTVTNVARPHYIAGLENLLKSTPKRVQANYLVNRVMLKLLPFLPRNLRKLPSRHGLWKHSRRFERCALMTAWKFKYATQFSYLHEYVDSSKNKHAQELVQKVKSSFVDMLKQVTWMDDGTKKAALNKASKMITRVGYNEDQIDGKTLLEYYSKLKVTTNNYMEYDLVLLKFLFDKWYEYLQKPIKNTEWSDTFSIDHIRVSYNFKNILDVPVTMLQHPYFDINRPNYMNYGSLGFLTGHALVHGFDDFGKHFEFDGLLKEWWSQHTSTSFDKQLQCIVNQYGNYTVREIKQKLNSHLTKREDSADNGGIKAAYHAYTNLVKTIGAEKGLAKLKYSPNQLFWISAANAFCTEINQRDLRWHVSGNSHSPPAYRIIGSFSNSEEFAKDFNCPKGSHMNPEKKCLVW